MRSEPCTHVAMFALTVFACSPRSVPAVHTSTALPASNSASTPAVPIAKLSLVQEVAGKHFPVPLVHALVNGVDTLLVVDTGASNNVVTSAFARAHAIPLGTTVVNGTGHANEAVGAVAISSVTLGVGSVSRTLTDALAVASPPIFETLGIGGFLSPQNFFQGTTVLDFPRHEIVVLRGDEAAVTAWLNETYPGQSRQAVAQKPGPEPRRIFVEASVDANPAVLANLDTGGSATEFLASYIGGASTSVGNSEISVSGTNVASNTVPDRTVVLGGLRFGPMPIEAREKMERYEGVIGMTVLSHVAVVIPQDRTKDIILIRAPN